MTMKIALALAATLAAGSAFAQGTGNLGSQQPYVPGTQAPSFQQGSGQRAGGPANELNTNGPTSTGTVVVTPPSSTTTVIETQPGTTTNQLNTTTVPAR